MKLTNKLMLAFLVAGMPLLTSFTASEKVKSTLKEESITYVADGVTMKGFVVYDSDIKGKRPAILVVPEWWGLNDYPKNRARQLAALGYIALAVDMYGNGKIAADPKEAQALAGTFYQNPLLGKTRLDAAIMKIKEYPQTDPANVAAIGYCFGGSMVLNSAKLGSDLVGVVSFHGGLAGVKPDKNLLKSKMLVCHGGSDNFVPQNDVDVFKHQLDSVGANYTVKVYPNATHAFTNPDATANGKKFNMPIEYNAEADKNSWNDMKMFFASLFK
jgi:dienelactone hydrolase